MGSEMCIRDRPYSGELYLTGSTSMSTAVSTLTGDNAPIDWLLVELLDATNPGTRIAVMAAIMQRDGDVVDAQTGTQTLSFPAVSPGNYYIALKHRNHLAVLSAAPIALSGTAQLVDFSSPAFNVYGQDARYVNNTCLLYTSPSPRDS